MNSKALDVIVVIILIAVIISMGIGFIKLVTYFL